MQLACIYLFLRFHNFNTVVRVIICTPFSYASTMTRAVLKVSFELPKSFTACPNILRIPSMLAIILCQPQFEWSTPSAYEGVFETNVNCHIYINCRRYYCLQVITLYCSFRILSSYQYQALIDNSYSTSVSQVDHCKSRTNNLFRGCLMQLRLRLAEKQANAFQVEKEKILPISEKQYG